ncbi:hypothetical protein U5A82_01650 [Sphingobium sp. CR2-8]|uniref:hypothetical protein n=1 Tax=Sphingobium sp. CR2-8 TaxID=1306534 RepID=UPI002DBB9A34|nr:hypothetical protein [Sphingobium sp. CR2-8]MEC3909222.1 hypothetical protein [Sphingobium sp. CR2-8]
MALVALNLVGYGCGPLLVGVLNDVPTGAGGLGETEGLRWTLILTACIGGRARPSATGAHTCRCKPICFIPFQPKPLFRNMETTHA